ncbi:MAG TPA: DoxX family protein [Chitinophagaceae bacterium]|nr:DoxX family protein [Chitinophagales bacterium]HMZ45978.1 DoxX family protein [Chitinophagaceae bacterium]HMX61363.1 DoxX family protein [Chitinophagales bacterium]HMY24268.1 DoxX family protein [Chitinophagales bacterium]HNA40137.1 DoxX family protein [Chitinophagales bacterium]
MFNKFSTDYGLLIIRIGIGVMFALHGFPKITGGPEKWEMIGKAMENIGIGFAPTFWGFMAAVAEFVGGICLVLGFLFRPATAMLLFTMFIAAFMHYVNGDGFSGYSHAVESAIVFLGLFFSGPGKYALKISRR